MHDDKKEAIRLRKEEKSYREISSKLGVSKSTLSDWLADKKWSQKIKKKLIKKSKEEADHSHLKHYSKKRSKEAARKREKDKARAADDINEITKENLKLIGTALYWAEGGKKSNNEFNFSNSDPKMIKVMMKFLREIVEIPDDEIQAKIHLYPDTNQESAIQYWKKVTDLPEENFPSPQTQISRSSKKKRSNRLPNGTLHLRIYNTELVSKIKGWIRGIINQS
ncbi:MAG: helix-turn-helix domain-containing protein [Candidatus Paceibacterota bacterium]